MPGVMRKTSHRAGLLARRTAFTVVVVGGGGGGGRRQETATVVWSVEAVQMRPRRSPPRPAAEGRIRWPTESVKSLDDERQEELDGRTDRRQGATG